MVYLKRISREEFQFEMPCPKYHNFVHKMHKMLISKFHLYGRIALNHFTFGVM